MEEIHKLFDEDRVHEEELRKLKKIKEERCSDINPRINELQCKLIMNIEKRRNINRKMLRRRKYKLFDPTVSRVLKPGECYESDSSDEWSGPEHECDEPQRMQPCSICRGKQK